MGLLGRESSGKKKGRVASHLERKPDEQYREKVTNHVKERKLRDTCCANGQS